jgi:hypothetical protein
MGCSLGSGSGTSDQAPFGIAARGSVVSALGRFSYEIEDVAHTARAPWSGFHEGQS